MTVSVRAEIDEAILDLYNRLTSAGFEVNPVEYHKVSPKNTVKCQYLEHDNRNEVHFGLPVGYTDYCDLFEQEIPDDLVGLDVHGDYYFMVKEDKKFVWIWWKHD